MNTLCVLLSPRPESVYTFLEAYELRHSRVICCAGGSSEKLEPTVIVRMGEDGINGAFVIHVCYELRLCVICVIHNLG